MLVFINNKILLMTHAALNLYLPVDNFTIAQEIYVWHHTYSPHVKLMHLQHV